MSGLSGRLMSRIRTSVGVPAPTGRAVPSAHAPDGPTAPDRSQGVAGNPPPASMTGPVPSPDDSGPRPSMTHYADGSHYGPDGIGDGDASAVLASADDKTGGRSGGQPAFGSAGAAHGGVRPSGTSLPWANPLGIRMGERYVPVTTVRPFGTAPHFNSPSLRPIRWTPPVRETGSPYPGGRSGTGTPATSPFNPAVPGRTALARLPRPLPVQRTGHGLTADQVPGDYSDGEIIGGGLAL